MTHIINPDKKVKKSRALKGTLSQSYEALLATLKPTCR